MKYARLTKEQLESLHKEFINFLATQSITGEEWDDIKTNKPEVAEQELDVFCDMIWEGVLEKVEYLEHFSKDQIHLFHLTQERMHLIAIKVKNVNVNLLTDEGYKWLQDHLLNDDVSFFNAKKEYNEDKNLDKFKIIQQGAQITKGQLYTYFAKLLEAQKSSEI